jgi:hypothetical protein
MATTIAPPPASQEREAGRRPRRWALIVLSLLTVLGAAWTLGWLYLARQTDAAITEAMAREAERGHALSCESRRTSGFPFRMVVRCDKAKLEIARPDGTVTFSLPSLSGFARIGDPRRIIIKAQGPLSVETPGQQAMQIAWRSLRTSILPMATGTAQKDMVIEAPSLRPRDGQSKIIAAADRLEIETRPDTGRPAEDDAIEVAATLTGLVSPIADWVAGNANPADVATVLSVSRASALERREEEPATPLLELWRLAGGRLRVVQASAAKGTLKASLSGEIALDDARRVSGRLDISLDGADALVSRLGLPVAAVGLLKLGGGSLRLPVTMANGRVAVGPITVGRLVPLY